MFYIKFLRQRRFGEIFSIAKGSKASLPRVRGLPAQMLKTINLMSIRNLSLFQKLQERFSFQHVNWKCNGFQNQRDVKWSWLGVAFTFRKYRQEPIWRYCRLCIEENRVSSYSCAFSGVLRKRFSGRGFKFMLGLVGGPGGGASRTRKIWKNFLTRRLPRWGHGHPSWPRSHEYPISL